MVIGIDSHLRLMMDLADEMSVLVEDENSTFMCEGQAYAALSDSRFQEHKLRLYQRFNTLSRIVTRMAEAQDVGDAALVMKAAESILRMRRAMTANSALMRSYVEDRTRIIASIMAGIDSVDAATYVSVSSSAG